MRGLHFQKKNFTEYFKLVVSGEWSEFLLDTLMDYANRQKKRLSPSN